MNQISIAAAGFSVIALILLFFQNRTETKTANILARTLLFILIIIQILQVMYINGYLLLDNTIAFFYLLSLGLVGPVFYLYSQHILQSSEAWSRRENWHFMPAFAVSVTGSLFPDYFTLAYSFTFFVGGIYMLRLAWSLYRLREKRTLFKMEFLFTAIFLAWSIAVVLMGILSSLAMEFLLSAQTIMLSLAIAGAIHIQLNYPHLLSSLEEIAKRQYQTSTLVNVDSEAAKNQLMELMSVNKVYQDDKLSLSSCAELLSLKPHQLSELLNTQLGMSFSYFLRYQRIKAAEVLLKSEPKISVLAVGLSVGFSSQSAFYSAFKELHAIAPGQYRHSFVK